MSARGLTLLETMIALVILGLVATGFLALFQGAARLATDSHRWSEAVAYAEDGMEAVKLEPRSLVTPWHATLAGGYERTVEWRAWDDSVRLVTVLVTLPGGGRMSLSRLIEVR